MDEERMTEALSAYVGGLSEGSGIELPVKEREQLVPLLRLADQLQQTMRPVEPSLAFVRSLRDELEKEAQRQIALRKRKRRFAVIGAAAVGSVVSVASLVGAIVVLVRWLRTRTQTHQASAA
jgi:hypothetical protein